jgi:hypothetical protein
VLFYYLSIDLQLMDVDASDRHDVDRRMHHSRGVAEGHYERRAAGRLKEKVVRVNLKSFAGERLEGQKFSNLHVAEQLANVSIKLSKMTTSNHISWIINFQAPDLLTGKRMTNSVFPQQTSIGSKRRIADDRAAATPKSKKRKKRRKVVVDSPDTTSPRNQQFRNGTPPTFLAKKKHRASARASAVSGLTGSISKATATCTVTSSQGEYLNPSSTMRLRAESTFQCTSKGVEWRTNALAKGSEARKDVEAQVIN